MGLFAVLFTLSVYVFALIGFVMSVGVPGMLLLNLYVGNALRDQPLPYKNLLKLPINEITGTAFRGMLYVTNAAKRIKPRDLKSSLAFASAIFAPTRSSPAFQPRPQQRQAASVPSPDTTNPRPRPRITRSTASRNLTPPSGSSPLPSVAGAPAA